MQQNRLIIGNKRYSSWSLRGWLALKFAGIPFEEIVVPLQQENTAREITRHGNYPAKVPTLLQNDRAIWDSLSLMEFAAEQNSAADLWPADPARRAHARSICAEMHAGFAALRNEIPMDFAACMAPAAKSLSQDARSDIRRILDIWEECLGLPGRDGPYLFGGLTLADAAYAPVVVRFLGAAIEVGATVEDYMQAIWSQPDIQEWRTAADQEEWVLTF